MPKLARLALRLIGAGLTTFALMGDSDRAAAQVPQSPPTCSWGIEISPEGFGNFTFPDNFARYWAVPFVPEWSAVVIHGSFPKARYFSFVAYDNLVSTKVASSIHDVQITPDPGSNNPFVNPDGGDGTYTVTVSRGNTSGGDTPNQMSATAEFSWIFLRVYVPDQNENAMGGVPLPTVIGIDQSGGKQTLEPCARANRLTDITTLVNAMFPPGFDTPDSFPVQTDRIWLASPTNPPPRIWPNPDNKYIFSPLGSFQNGRVLVIRGKAPNVPDTYSGGSVLAPKPHAAPVQMRYWSICQADFVSPLPVVQCATDVNTKLDEDGFYTYVLTDTQLPPSWLPEDVNWIPWGDDQLPKAILLRNMLPRPGFQYSIQNAVNAGCTADIDFPTPPTPEALQSAGQCTANVMRQYYPIVVWCDQSVFVNSGWQACFE